MTNQQNHNQNLSNQSPNQSLQTRGLQAQQANFWHTLPKPFFCLAPMADVTDAAFREIIAKYSRHGEPGGGPHVFWTEFVSADGLASPGREALLHDLKFSDKERPIVAQFFTANPDTMRQAAALARELGFDGIDINMGCPDKSIEKQGAGACMIKTPDVAKAVIRAAKEGAEHLPVSVKTRIGYSKNEIATWIPALLEENIAALTIHCRTRKELSLVPARWEHVKEVVAIRNRLGVATKIVGNGDVRNLHDAKEKASQTGCDGVMIGRAVFGNPWIFDETKQPMLRTKKLSFKESLQKLFGKHIPNKYWHDADIPIPLEERLRVFVEHAELFEEYLGDVKSFDVLKKHMKGYVHGFEGAKELRLEIAKSKSASELQVVVQEFLNHSLN